MQPGDDRFFVMNPKYSLRTVDYEVRHDGSTVEARIESAIASERK
jgi:hypothetical protein